MKLVKILIGAAATVPATVTPLATLTSCGQQWGRLSAFSIGSAIGPNGNPYRHFMYDEDKPEQKDYDGNDYRGYLQSNYSVKQTTNETYAYSTPAKWTYDEQKKEGDWKQKAPSGWYTPADPVFQSSASYKDKDGKDQISTCTRNEALANNITFITSVGSIINTLISNALSYQTSQIQKNKVQNEEIATCWGANAKQGKQFTFDHGDITGSRSQVNKDFYEYCFALANLNGGQKSRAMLRTSHVNFSFAPDAFPLPTYTFSNDGKRQKLSNEFIKMIEGVDKPAYTKDNLTHYTSRVEATVKEGEPKYCTFTYELVPIFINVDSITQRYLNPLIDWSFLVNDYYTTKDDITSTIGNMWKDALPSLTGYTPDQAIPHYKSYDITTGNVAFDKHTYTNIDTRIPSTIKGNQFVALATYDLQVYEEGHHEKDKATLRGVSNIFPAYWLDIYDTANDSDWYKKANDKNNEYTLNPDKINVLTTKLREIVESTAYQGVKPSNLSQEQKNLLSFLGYMFGNIEGQNRKIETEQVIKPVNI